MFKKTIAILMLGSYAFGMESNSIIDNRGGSLGSSIYSQLDRYSDSNPIPLHKLQTLLNQAIDNDDAIFLDQLLRKFFKYFKDEIWRSPILYKETLIFATQNGKENILQYLMTGQLSSNQGENDYISNLIPAPSMYFVASFLWEVSKNQQPNMTTLKNNSLEILSYGARFFSERPCSNSSLDVQDLKTMLDFAFNRMDTENVSAILQRAQSCGMIQGLKEYLRDKHSEISQKQYSHQVLQDNKRVLLNVLQGFLSNNMHRMCSSQKLEESRVRAEQKMTENREFRKTQTFYPMLSPGMNTLTLDERKPSALNRSEIVASTASVIGSYRQGRSGSNIGDRYLSAIQGATNSSSGMQSTETSKSLADRYLESIKKGK